MHSMRALAGLVLGLALMVVASLLEGANLRALFFLPAAIVVGAGAVAAVVIAFPLATCGESLRAVFGNSAERGDARRAQRFFAVAGRGALLSGFLGALLGAVHIFQNFDRPEAIGPGVALALLSIAYGFGANVFLAQPLASLARGKAKARTAGGAP